MEPRPSVDDCKVMRFLGAVIKPVHPCTGLIARFAQQNALLLRTTDIRVGTEKKTPPEQNSSGKKIGAESAVLHFVFFIVMVNKMQQSAKENCLLKRNTLPEVFPLTAILAGSGKTKPFEKRHAGCEEREKINRRRIYDTLRINFFEATKQTACIFSKGEETGVNYYGARYLDPKYSRWLSGDPALGDYVPAADTDPSKLAGMGGVYNTVNLHLYHYAGNNPIKYTDPTGREDEGFSSSQQKQILEAKEKAINNINLIIDYINNYGKNGNLDARLKKTAKAYLNFDMDNFGDRKDLISALQSIATDLSSMSLSDFKHTDDYSSGGIAYVQPEIVMKGSQIISTRFLKDMYLTDAAFIGNPDYGNGLDAIFIHEESHKVLGTKDILYDYGTRDIIYKPGTTDILFGRDDDCRKLPNNQKISNADNWKLFYFKMGK